MSYSYARINLEKTNYSKIDNTDIIDYYPRMPQDLDNIYYKYCNHHAFNSVMPLFPIEYEENTIHGYYDTNHDGLYDDYHNHGDSKIMVGFSMKKIRVLLLTICLTFLYSCADMTRQDWQAIEGGLKQLNCSLYNVCQ